MEPLFPNDPEVQGSQGIHRVDAVRAEGIRAAARVLVVLFHLDKRVFGFVRSGQRVGAGRPQRIERRPLHLLPKLEVLLQGTRGIFVLGPSAFVLVPDPLRRRDTRK